MPGPSDLACSAGSTRIYTQTIVDHPSHSPRDYIFDLCLFYSGTSSCFAEDASSDNYAEATNNARHWASRDTTSSGTRMISDLSHEACSSRLFSRLSPVFAALV